MIMQSHKTTLLFRKSKSSLGRALTDEKGNRSLRIHVDKVGMSYMDEASQVLSVLYGLLLVVLAIVLKVSESIKTPQNKTVKTSNVSKSYLCCLFFAAIVFPVGFKIFAVCWRKKHDKCQLIKSPHASNRWLKAIVAIFGFSVIVKESLEIIGYVEIKNPDCYNKHIYFLTPLSHALFVVGQVVFLFFYAKIHIQDFTFLSRFGIMHAMATNLAVWICIISDETNHALAYEASHHNHSSPDIMADNDKHKLGQLILGSNCSERSEMYDLLIGNTAKQKPEAGLFKGECFCHSDVCIVIAQANQFLSPMMIEFCLVASCLLYVTWSNVGREMKDQPGISKPSYKFYKSYAGVMFGTGILLGTVIVMMLLASLESGFSPDQKRYFTEHKYLAIYDAFMSTCNILMLIACMAGLYVSSVHTEKKLDCRVDLDVVLLFICLVGPLLVGLFSILSLIAGPTDTKKSGWRISLLYAFTDIFVSVVQILFIVHGLSRKPATSSPADFLAVNPLLRNSREDPYGQDAVNDVMKNEFFHLPNCDGNKNEMIKLDQLRGNEGNALAETSLNTMDTYRTFLPSLSTHRNNEESKALVEQPTNNDLAEARYSQGSLNSRIKSTKAEAGPSRTRLIYRDIIMFLVVSNSCLWMLLSLNGTAFKIYAYQSEYFGHSAWTTLTSVTKPLSIFLKLHSAACFFEIWSYS